MFLEISPDVHFLGIDRHGIAWTDSLTLGFKVPVGLEIILDVDVIVGVGVTLAEYFGLRWMRGFVGERS